MVSAIHNLSAYYNLILKNANRIVAALEKSTYFTYTRELTHIVDNHPKVVSADEAVQCIKSGDYVFVGGAAATPIALSEAMAEHGRRNKLKNVTVLSIHTEGKARYSMPEFEGIFRSYALFMSANARQAVAEGRGDSVPIFLNDIPQIFHRKIIQPDVALIHLSPPDKHGFCSMGTSVDCVRAGVIYSKILVAQVNPNMPRTFGDGAIHISHLDYIVKVNDPLPSLGGEPPSPEEKTIGKLIADNLVEDGATLQMGIGSLPDAVLALLDKHKNLGIHTEMFSMGIVDLVRKGNVTNSLKPVNTGLIVSALLMGNKELYDFVDDNPSILLKTVEYTNSTSIIRIHPKMTSINSCVEVDLTGQVCSDSVGTRILSGFGGQVDFHRGAAEGTDGKGKAIIALQSVNKKTNESKIVPFLRKGAGVVTTRGHINYIVTEQGIANLFGKTMRQRARALIQVAHPDYREALEKAAIHRFKEIPDHVPF